MSRRLAIATIVITAAAAGCGESDHGPVRPGSGGNGNSSAPDAAPPSPDAAGPQTIAGTLCNLADPRSPTICEAANLDGIAIEDPGSAVNTAAAANGAFSLTVTVAPAVLLAGNDGGPQRPSMISFADFNRLGQKLPTMTSLDYDELALQLAVIEPNDTASIALYVRKDGVPEPGVEATPPAGTLNVFYDDDIAGWDSLGQTETAGAILLFAVPLEAGIATVSIANSDASIVGNVDIPVRSGITTFAVVDLVDF